MLVALLWKVIFFFVAHFLQISLRRGVALAALFAGGEGENTSGTRVDETAYYYRYSRLFTKEY